MSVAQSFPKFNIMKCKSFLAQFNQDKNQFFDEFRKSLAVSSKGNFRGKWGQKYADK